MRPFASVRCCFAAAGSVGPKPEAQIFPRSRSLNFSLRCRVAPFLLTNATIRLKAPHARLGVSHVDRPAQSLTPLVRPRAGLPDTGFLVPTAGRESSAPLSWWTRVRRGTCRILWSGQVQAAGTRHRAWRAVCGGGECGGSRRTALRLSRARNRGYYVGSTRNALRAPRNRHVIGRLRAYYYLRAVKEYQSHLRYQGELLGIWDPRNRDPRRKPPPETKFSVG